MEESTADSDSKRTYKSSKACLCTAGVFLCTPSVVLSLLLLNFHIHKNAGLAVNCNNIPYHWRGSLRNVVHSLIVQEVLEDLILDMTTDVMETEYCFIHPYTVTLETRASWKQMTRISSWFGFGVFRSSREHALQKAIGPTVQNLKVSAILACAHRSFEEGQVNRNILILSDNQAALLTVKGYQLTSKPV